jgi:hypothetical protein
MLRVMVFHSSPYHRESDEGARTDVVADECRHAEPQKSVVGDGAADASAQPWTRENWGTGRYRVHYPRRQRRRPVRAGVRNGLGVGEPQPMPGSALRLTQGPASATGIRVANSHSRAGSRGPWCASMPVANEGSASTKSIPRTYPVQADQGLAGWCLPQAACPSGSSRLAAPARSLRLVGF